MHKAIDLPLSAADAIKVVCEEIAPALMSISPHSIGTEEYFLRFEHAGLKFSICWRKDHKLNIHATDSLNPSRRKNAVYPEDLTIKIEELVELLTVQHV